MTSEDHAVADPRGGSKGGHRGVPGAASTVAPVASAVVSSGDPAPGDPASAIVSGAECPGTPPDGPSGGTGAGAQPAGGRRAVAGSEARYRAGELAAEAGISVQALRGYQSKGLLPPPRHEGRVAWYGAIHRERLERIRHLKARGYSLRMIAETLDDDVVGSAAAALEDHAVLRLADVAEQSGVPVEMLRALEASGLLRPHEVTGSRLYSEADVRFVRQVLALLGVGLSLDDFMRIARPLITAIDALGGDVVGAWGELVGRRLRDDRPGTVDGDAAARVAESLRSLAAIVGQLVGYHVERTVLDAARADIEAHGSAGEREALSRHLTSPS